MHFSSRRIDRTSESATETISIRWPGGERSSFRAPAGLAARIDQFLKVLQKETGIHLSRNQFIMKTTRWYLHQIMKEPEETWAKMLTTPFTPL